jgi:hypothetical protein
MYRNGAKNETEIGQFLRNIGTYEANRQAVANEMPAIRLIQSSIMANRILFKVLA